MCTMASKGMYSNAQSVKSLCTGLIRHKPQNQMGLRFYHVS